jgi:hypothetical protein
MFNHNLMSFDSLGRIRCTLEQVEEGYFNGGTPIKDGLVCLTSIPAEVFLQSFGYTHAGSVCSVQAAEADIGYLGGNGSLRTVGGEPTHWWCGLPFSEDGFISIVIEGGEPPIETSGFTNGFDGGFK